MKTVIHDLSREDFAALGPWEADTVVFAADGKYASCQGCFRCWLQHAGFCVRKDVLRHAGALIGESDPLILVSRLYWGSYSSPVKAVLDRAIGVSLPFFTFRGGQTHHLLRYPQRDGLQVFFYGESTPRERQIAQALVERNRLNLGYRRAEARFFPTWRELREVVG